MTRSLASCLMVAAALIAGCASQKAAPLTVLAAPAGTTAKAAELMTEGNRLAAAQDWQGAKQAYQAAATAQPDLAEAHYNLAVCLDRLGAKAEAKKHYMTAANLAPGHKVIWDAPPFRETGLTHNIDKKSFLDPSPRSGF